MKTIARKIILCIVVLTGWQFQQSMAQYSNTTQQEDPAYAKVIEQRVAKIVEPLQLKNVDKQKQASRVIQQQYFDLNRIYQARNEKVKAIKASTTLDEAGRKAAVDLAKQDAEEQVKVLHPQYIARLNALLTPKQVTEVKDGMTYHTLDVTYKAYTNMLPNLKEEQKKQMMAWLVEAREYAIDGGTSEEKHSWFGKYKGRINNYLAKDGIDMKAAEIAWKKREEASKKM